MIAAAHVRNALLALALALTLGACPDDTAPADPGFVSCDNTAVSGSCTIYPQGTTVDQAQGSCDGTAYSGVCSTAGLVGSCDAGGLTTYYYDSHEDETSAQARCDATGGTFSLPESA